MNVRFERCKQLWERIKELESSAEALKSAAGARVLVKVVENKAGVADHIIPILIEEVSYYKEKLEKLMMTERMSPQDGSIHEFDDRITSSNGTCFDDTQETEEKDIQSGEED